MLMKNIILFSPLKEKFKINKVTVRKNLLMIFFCMLLFGGIVFGAVSSGNADKELLGRLDFIFNTNYDIRCTNGFLSAFVASFASAVIFLLIIFLLGLSLWGGIFTVLVPLFKGYGYGLAVGFLYSSYGLKGIFYNLFIILPGAFICSLVIASAAQEALKNSLKLTSCFVKSTVRDDPHIQMKRYMLSMLWYLGLCAVASLIDMLCSLCFSWLFQF